MRTARAAALIGIVILTVTAIAPAARAESAFRYWAYWQGNAGTWQFGTQGSATTNPADGAVEGWRFAVAGATGSKQSQPSIDPATAFNDLCGSTPLIDGKKRVALIVDPGYGSEAPDGEQPFSALSTCVTADADASGYDILRSQLNVRVQGGFVCGIAGYPAHECAPVIDASEPSAKPTAVNERPSKDSLTSFGSISLTVLVVIFGIGLAIALWWRRK